MKRSALHALVWVKPMRTIAAELGVSDVGPAKSCRRHGIPTPPRGHWAKLAVGKPSPVTRLPQPADDFDVPLPKKSAAGLRRKRTGGLPSPVRPTEPAVVDAPIEICVSTTLDIPHPLVRATAAHCHRVTRLIAQHERNVHSVPWRADRETPPYAQHGRYELSSPGSLNMLASLGCVDWALRFHDAIFKGLAKAGVKVVHVRAADRPQHSQDRRDGVAAELDGERIFISFKEGYRRTAIESDELATLREKDRFAGAWRTGPSGKFTFHAIGTKAGNCNDWRGTDRELGVALPGIVGGCLALLRNQSAVRTARLARESASRLQAERDARERRVQEAQAKQLDNAFEAAATHERVTALKRFLLSFEEELKTFRAPYADRARVWLGVVRAEFEKNDPYNRILLKCLSQEPWQKWPPEWWPEGVDSQTTHLEN